MTTSKAKVEDLLADAVRPLVDRIDGTLLRPSEMRDGDVPIIWDGVTVLAVRVASGLESGGLAMLIETLEKDFAAPLAQLDRDGKREAVRLLEQRGAFAFRKSAETVAEALGVTRFTVYNYLNRSSD